MPHEFGRAPVCKTSKRIVQRFGLLVVFSIFLFACRDAAPAVPSPTDYPYLKFQISHEGSEGVTLGAQQGETVFPGTRCAANADAIQALALRVNRGECVRVTWRNALPGSETASFHLHASGLVVASNGSPAVASNPRATIFPGETASYEWMVRAGEPEGAHYFHSHGDDRAFVPTMRRAKTMRWMR